MWNMERIRPTASEKMSFENVDGWTDDVQTDGRRMSRKKRYTPDIFGWFLWHIFFICQLNIFKFGNKLKGIKIHIRGVNVNKNTAN